VQNSKILGGYKLLVRVFTAIFALEKMTRFPDILGMNHSQYFQDVPFVMLSAIASLRSAFYIERHKHVISNIGKAKAEITGVFISCYAHSYSFVMRHFGISLIPF
jgi:hypothetical protein